MREIEKKGRSLSDVMRTFGPSPRHVPLAREELRKEAFQAGGRIYKNTMHGKLKLTLDA